MQQFPLFKEACTNITSKQQEQVWNMWHNSILTIINTKYKTRSLQLQVQIRRSKTALGPLWVSQHVTHIQMQTLDLMVPVAYPGIFFFGGGSTNSVVDRGQREWGSGGGSPLVRGSGGSCNLVQEISFQIVNFLNFWYIRLFMMKTNLFVIANVKQLRT
jgi:hypothetical protein